MNTTEQYLPKPILFMIRVLPCLLEAPTFGHPWQNKLSLPFFMFDLSFAVKSDRLVSRS